jgi:hypothetical protein
MLGDIFDCRCIEICMFVIVFSILVLQLEVCRFTQRGDFNALYKCVVIQFSASKQFTSILHAKYL